MPTTKPRPTRTPTGLPQYEVVLELPAGNAQYRLETVTLDDLADRLESEFRVVHPNKHIGVRLDPNGTVMVRVGWTPSEAMGTWKSASA